MVQIVKVKSRDNNMTFPQDLSPSMATQLKTFLQHS